MERYYLSKFDEILSDPDGEWVKYSDVTDLETQLQQAQSEITQLQKKQCHWIPVSERLPEPDRDVLAIAAGEVLIAFLPSGDDYWCDLCDNQYHNVTHWMPLPQPPEGGDLD